MKPFPKDLILETIDLKSKPLADFDEKVLLIVNTASECGFTGQYQGLVKLHESYLQQGFSVLGFPCDQFGHQEPGSNVQIQQFCQTTYQVDFPMFSKTEVNGPDTHPLFVWLKEAAPGVMGTQRIKWNFTKFLVSRDRSRVHRYASTTTPEQIVNELELELQS
ncbi:glutathione peroxidase [Celerinatantimonas sp. MCCC 1A17872]|uniref:glutathione peroxidase n=1 Tax=Celerinatantimonas sp. MCCC 1A17872 TaxID=3177514 RepID=UPI0038C03C93